MKVAVFETEEWEHQACLRLQPTHVVSCTRDPLNERTAGAHADAETVSTFINSNLAADVLARFPQLKLVATRSTGYDHIDLAYCAAHDITVCNVPDYGDSTVAEHVFALLLGIARHLVEAVERTRRGNFGQAGLRGFELRDKVLGVIEEAARELVQSGAAELVALTLGRDGALLVSGSGALRLDAPDVVAKSAVGAGDSFVAAMTLGLAQGRSPEDAFAYGVAAGAAAVLSAGTGLCRGEDVERLYAEIEKKSLLP